MWVQETFRAEIFQAASVPGMGLHRWDAWDTWDGCGVLGE